MAVNHPLLLLIFLLAFKTGFSAEISVFVQTGNSVQLDIQTHELPFLYWDKDNSTKIVTYISQIKEAIYDTSYKERLNFNTETFSLTLKNMQKTDSGLYRARAVGVNAYVAAYRVSVMDAVKAPFLTVNSNWSSSDSCTVNFTCGARELMIHSSYQNNRCSPEEVTSHENYTLILYCSEESIICNHSNPVSTKKDRIEIKQICVKNKGHKSGVNETKPPLQIWAFILIGVCVFLAIAIFLFVYRKFIKGAREADNTVYAQVEAQEMQKINSDGNTYDVPDRVQRHTHEETRDNLPNTTYCTVGQHQKPADFPEMDRTIYAAVCKQPKPPAISSDDA